MSFRITLRGEEPSGRMLALLCARTGDSISSVKKMLRSPEGLALKEGLSREKADELVSNLPPDDSVEVAVKREVDSWVAVLMGYRPGSRGRLRVALQRMSRLSTEEVIHFLASIPIALKSGIDLKTARAIKDALEREGGIVEIHPHRRSAKGYVPSTGAALEEPAETVVPPPDSPEETPPSNGPPGSPPHVPPRVGGAVPESVPVSQVPPELCFSPPDKKDIPLPGVVPDETENAIPSAKPYPVRFTVPGRRIPPVITVHDTHDQPPEATPAGMAVPIFLHPVSPGQKASVGMVLSEALGIPLKRCGELIEMAPVAVWASSDRFEALVALKGLSEKGIPVSLIPASAPPRATRANRSVFGWMNGNR